MIRAHAVDSWDRKTEEYEGKRGKLVVMGHSLRMKLCCEWEMTNEMKDGIGRESRKDLYIKERT